MVRSISSNGLAKLAQNLGTEPIIIIEVQWAPDGARVAYADREIGATVKGAILEVSGLESVVQVSQGADSQQLSVKLDDTDGSLKQIIDTLDIHKRPCWVYQYFDGLDLDDKFLLFSGQINTPIEWNEGDRTLAFDIVSRIEDVEIGFSLEEGITDSFDEELIGKPWPLCFGTVNNVPSLRLRPPASGTLAQGTGIHDFTLPRRIAAAGKLCCPPIQGTGTMIFLATTGASIGQAAFASSGIYTDPNCLAANCVTLKSLELEYSEQKNYEISPVKIFGGERFPQNTPLTLAINNGKFTGTFAGDIFTITSRLHPDNDGKNRVVQSEYKQTMKALCGSPDPVADCEPQYVQTVFGPVLDDCSCKQAALDAIEPASFFWANAGSQVVIDSEQEIVYVANLIQSTVLRVAAYRNLNGARQLIDVPTDYYTVRYTDYTGYNAVTEIVLSRPLSTRDLDNGAGWEDDLYITMTSDVGPNTVDIIEWILDTYAPGYDQDATSFNAVRALIDNYPMHFALLERKNLIEFLQDVATQARCAFWLKDNTFYIRYLSLEPTADDTITEDDILPNSMVLYHTATEDLVTKQVNEWKWDYAVDKPNKLILRHNVKKYGTHEKTNDYFAFTIQELVNKSATFWLIREANTWRKLRFRTPIHKLKLEPFDVVSLNLPDLSPNIIKGIVEKANLDSDALEIEFDVWTPLKAGTTTAYDFAWPADIDENSIFPTLDERELGLGGSGTEPNFSTVAPPGHILVFQQSLTLAQGHAQCSSIFAGPGSITDRTYNCHKDEGDKKPSDQGDTKPEPRTQSGTGQPSGTTGPKHLDVNVREEAQKLRDRIAQIDKKATDAQTTAGSAAQASGANEPKPAPESELEKLPEPDKDESGRCIKRPGDCVCYVHVGRITPSLVQKDDGSYSSTPGETGKITNGLLTSGGCIGFNSREAALAYRNAMGGQGQQGTNGVITDDRVTSTVDADLGSGAPGGPDCEDVGIDNAEITHYSPSGDPPAAPPAEEN